MSTKIYLKVSTNNETITRRESLSKGRGGTVCALSAQRMKELTPLIPGIYADVEGRAVVNMQEFLAAHAFPDAPELRAVIWEEIREVFGDVEVIEMPSGHDFDT